MLWNSKRSAGVSEESLTRDCPSSQIGFRANKKLMPVNSRFANQTRVILCGIRSGAQKPQRSHRVKNANPTVDPKRASLLRHSKKPWWRTRLKLSRSLKTGSPCRTIRSSNKIETIQATRRMRVPIVSRQADQLEQYKSQTRSTKPAGTSNRLKPADGLHPIGPRSRTTLYPTPAQ